MSPFHPTRWLAPLLEGELAEPRRSRVAAHLQRCPRCRRRLAEVERGLLAARELRPVRPPAGLERRLRAMASESVPALSPAPRRPRFAPWLLPAAAATAGALAIVIWSGGRGGVTIEAAETPAGALEQLALASERQLTDGSLALDLATTNPAVARRWLEARGLSAALVGERPDAERASFQLAGVADLSRPGFSAAAIAYRVDGAPLVLVAAHQAEAPDAPRWGLLGKRVRHRRAGAAQLLLWTNSGKAYALASTHPRLQRGCLLCHTDPRRRELVDELELPPSGSAG